jgi:hypothetical protein
MLDDQMDAFPHSLELHQLLVLTARAQGFPLAMRIQGFCLASA